MPESFSGVERGPLLSEKILGQVLTMADPDSSLYGLG
jgi:hypothetical protein